VAVQRFPLNSLSVNTILSRATETPRHAESSINDSRAR
jgi:hypothetical protein